MRDEAHFTVLQRTYEQQSIAKPAGFESYSFMPVRQLPEWPKL
jgi:hypothetical protein